ncbi:ATP synthase F0 subunit A [Boudabousia tangfeifanii]|uniref:ATP synthase subunit a n=1 Tax=Boudabousia tangfeifanii TaxID=1912795 RepID=A0A1D9MJN9_9ACTO|nr:F0F1 ATP synthase subunit A [Boudabousia tangfeifanii]AOZ72502.1 ATP synthase F0 subunit A [Boudabousia tangfeifanii]
MIPLEAPELPGMEDFFPEPFLFEGTPFEFNRIMLVRMVAVVFICLLFGIGASRVKLVPGRFQGALEMALQVVRVNVAEAVIESPVLARRYTPALTVIFFGILALNLTGIVPLLHIAGSSVVGVPIVFAVFAYVLFVGAGIRAQGFGHFFKNQLFPPGVPWPIYFLLTPVEAFSTFVVRPATLVIRLLANMIAGHILLALTFFGTHYLLFYASGLLKGVSVLTFGASILVVLLEILVAVVQAFVFSLLTAVYIQLSVSEH